MGNIREKMELLQKQLQCEIAKGKQMQTELEEKTRCLQNTSKCVKSLQSENEQIKDQMEALSGELKNEKKKQNTELKDKKEENIQLITSHSKLEAEIKRLKIELEEHTSGNNQSQQLLEEINKKKEDQEIKIEKLEAQLKRTKMVKIYILSKMEKLERQLEKEKQEMKQRSKMQSEIQEVTVELKAEIEQLKIELGQ